jgi:hypothetical protein
MFIPKKISGVEKNRRWKRTVAGWAETRDGAHLVRRASSSLVHPPRILKHFAFGETARRATKSKSSGRKSAGWSPAASEPNEGGRLPNALRGRKVFIRQKSSSVGARGGKRIDGRAAARARAGTARRGRGRTKDRRRGRRHTQSRRRRCRRRRTRPIRTSAPRGAGGSGWRVSGEVEKRDCEATWGARAEPTERAITHHLDVHRGTATLRGSAAAAPRHREGGPSQRVHRARRRRRRRFASGASCEPTEPRDARSTRIRGRIAGHANAGERARVETRSARDARTGRGSRRRRWARRAARCVALSPAPITVADPCLISENSLESKTQWLSRFFPSQISSRALLRFLGPRAHKKIISDAGSDSCRREVSGPSQNPLDSLPLHPLGAATMRSKLNT